jgi:hypothetical protein
MAHRRLTVMLVTILLVIGAGSAAAGGSDDGPSASTAESVSGLQVLNYRTFVREGALYVVGEIRNTSTKRINPFVTVTIAPGHNEATETLQSTSTVWGLVPGARSPFVIVRDPFAHAGTTVTAITAGGYVTEEPQGALGVSLVGAVTSDPALVGGTGDAVQYEIRNGTGRPVRIVSVVAGFRGANGKVSNVFAESFVSTPLEIPAGGTHQAWAASGPSGVLAVSAGVEVLGQFADGDGELLSSWSNWFLDTGANSLLSSIAWLAESGITGGCGPRLFCPGAPVTRAQMAIFLDRALDFPSTAFDYFTDDEGVTGEASINRMAAAGVTGGCTATTFCPGSPVTRAQMAAFLKRALD